MYIKASSVIGVFQNHPGIAIDKSDIYCPFPSCPKERNAHCKKDFPDCEGKNCECPQKLKLVKKTNEDPFFLHFDYFIDVKSRDGRIKKDDSTILLIKDRYGLDDHLFEPV